MSGQDWSIPDPGTLPKPKPSPWKVDVDPHRDNEVRIYQVPEASGVNRTPIRHVATCLKKADAELIVQLHDKYREEA